MPPRIAHVISARGIGGAERFLASLVEHVAGRGWNQLVLNPFASDASDALRALYTSAAFEGRRCDRLPELVLTRRWLRSHLDAFCPDVVHVMLFHAQTLLATVPRRPGTKRVITNVYGDGVKVAPRGRLIQPVDRWTGRRVDHVLAISGSVQRFLLSSYGYPPSRVTCIPLGWQGEPRPPSSDPRPPTVVCVGGLRREKGHDTLIAAMSLVVDQIPDARLVIVGDGDRRRALEADVVTRGLGANVEFAGAVPEVWPHLAEADVFASASRSEAFGIGIAEAMAAGLPVVAPAVGAIPELVRPGVTGQLFPAGDHATLARHLIALLRAPDLRLELGAAARTAADGLRMEHVVRRYFAVFEELQRQAREDGARAASDARGSGLRRTP